MKLTEVLPRQLDLSARRLLETLDGVTPAEAAARPDGLIPAIWHVGHVGVHHSYILRHVGYGPDIPEGWEEIFRKGSDGSGPYPRLDEVTAWFQSVREQIVRLAGEEERYSVPMEGAAWSTVGEALIWAHNHCGYHVGKVSTLRALLGKPVQR